MSQPLTSPQLTLVMGGVRSGKSAFAEELVRALGGPTGGFPILYLATGLATDAEMERRIQIHQSRRPTDWMTIEEPLQLAAGLKAALDSPRSPKAIIIDSIDVWVGNMLMEHEDEEKERVESLTLAALDDLLDTARVSPLALIMVSAEVGLSLVPPEPLGRRFQDLLGSVNQRIAAAAGRVYLVVAGVPLEIKGSQGLD